MIPPVLQDVVEYLISQNIVLPTGGGDGRTDSSIAEDMIVELLRQSGRWRIYSPKQEIGHNRAWYDVSINDLFCDIKISKCTANDNAQAKKAIYYLLTGDRETERVPEQHSDFFRTMRENEDPDEDRDYYYLVINKTDTSDIFIVNLKGIAVCNSAPNNMPFQVNWGQNYPEFFSSTTMYRPDIQ